MYDNFYAFAQHSVAVADRVMGGLGAPPPPHCPIDQNLGLVVAARSSLPQSLGQVFI